MGCVRAVDVEVLDMIAVLKAERAVLVTFAGIASPDVLQTKAAEIVRMFVNFILLVVGEMCQ